MAAALATVGLHGPVAIAGTFNWDTAAAGNPVTGGAGAWDIGTANWTQDDGVSKVVWGNTNADLAIFGVTGGAVALGSPITANALQFDITGYSITQNTGTLTFAGTTPTATVTNSADSATISAAILGSAGLTKTGAGTLVLGGVNTFTGGLNITAGTLSATALNQLGAGTIALNGGLLQTGGAITINSLTNGITIGAAGGTLDNVTGTKVLLSTAAGVLSGSGSFTRNASANNVLFGTGHNTMQISAANTGFTGAVILNGGQNEISTNGLGNGLTAGNSITINSGAELTASAGTIANPLIVNSGANIGGDNGVSTFSGPVTVNGAFKIRLGDFHASTQRNLIISNNITGTGDITFLNANTGTAGNGVGQTLFLNGNNSGYTSAINVPAGYNVSLGTINSFSAGTFTINSNTAAVGGIGVAYDFAGTLPTFTNTRTGTTIGGVFGINTTLAATTTIDLATLGGGGMFLGSQGTGNYAAITLGADAGVYRLGGGLGTLTLSGTNVLTGANALVIGEPTTTRVNTTGTISLTAANDYTGPTTINPGSTLQVSNAGALGSAGTGTTIAAGGALALTGGIMLNEPIVVTGTSSAASTTNLPNALVNVSGTNTYSGAITAATNSANFRISTTAGTLNLTGTIALSGGGNSTGLVFTGGATVIQSGTISGGGSVIGTSTGATTLSATNTYTGKTQIQQGSFRTPSLNSVTGGVAASGLGAPTTVAAGTIDLGNATTAGTLVYTGTGETTDRTINLLGTTAGGTIDQSGTGLLKFTSSLTATGAGAKTLTFQGATAGTGEFAGAIVNSTAATNVVKTGSGTWTLSGANTYTGTTAISGGNLIISSLANINSGTATSLGNPAAANGTINMGTTTTAATLTYVGTGSTSDRFINLNGTTAGAVIDNSGTGTFQIGGVNAGGAGTKTLTLQGSTSGLGIIAGAIVNNSATNLTNVTKTGLGTWLLGGTNTYTGTTTVTAGLLRINGNSAAATGAVNVNAGGLLGGTGTVGGAVAVAAGAGIDLRDGTTGTLTLGNTLTFSGTAALTNNVYFDLGNSGSAIDKIAATGAITAATANTVLVSFNQLAGAPIPDGVYTLMTSGATSVPSGFALATTQSGGHTYALTTSTTGNILQVTIGTAAAGPAATVWGGTTSAAWNAAGNWYTDDSSNTPAGAAPGVGTNVTFNTTTPVAGNLSTTLGADYQINSLTFLSTATSAVTIGGAANALTIDAGTANGNTAGNGISQLAAATHTISSRVGIAAAQTWTVASGGGLTVSGLVFDTGAGFTLTKAGAGTLTLSGTANTFTGNIDVTAGVLAFAGNAGANGDPLSLGAGNKFITVTNNAVIRPTSSANPTSTNTKRFVVGTGGATFDVPTGVTFALDDAGQFSGAADLTVTGTGTGVLYLNNQAFNFSGNVFVNSGTLRLGTNSVLGTTAGRNITVATGAVLDVNNNSTNIPLGITLNGTGISGGGALTANAASGTLAPAITLASASSVGGANTLTLTGPISGPFGLTKVGAGNTVLSGTNTYNAASGATTTVTAGMLLATKTASLPNYATAGQVSVTGGTLGLNVGGAGEFTAADVTTLLGNSGTFANNTGIALDTTNAGGSFTAPAITPTPAVATFNLTKLGTGTLVLPNANGFGNGATSVLNGTLSVTSGVTNPLGTGALVLGTTNGTPANLDLGISDQTFTTVTVPSNSTTPNTITIGPGNALTTTGSVTIGANTGAALTTNLTVTGATGTWSVGTATTPTNANFQIGGNTTTNFSNGSTVDLSGLGTFYANLGTGTFRVGDATNSGGTATLNATLILSPTSTIRATTITSDSPDSGRTQTIRLGGGVNTFNATTVNIGGTASGRSNGILEFAGASGSLVVRNLAGTARAGDMNIAYGATATGAGITSTVTLTGHSADLLLTNLNVGGRTATTGGSSTGTFTFNTGTLDVNTINIARRNITSTDTAATRIGTSTGTVNIDGGTVTINNGVVVGQNTSTIVSNPTNGTLNISGGNVSIGGATTSITLGSSANATNGPATANLNITGGTTTLAGNIIAGTATGVTATVTLNGGTLNMAGKFIGSATNLVTMSAQSGTLDRLGELNGGGAFVKTGAGTLMITGASTYTGATTVNAGTLLINGSVTSNVTATAGKVGGIGSIAGTLTIADATLAPGNSPGVLSVTGAVALGSGSTYAVEVGGSTPGNTNSNYDQTITSAATPNSITLGGGALSVVGFNDYATTDTFADPTKAAYILVQGGANPVIGTFAGLPTDGSPVIFADGGTALITYSANFDSINGSTLTGGNDVALYNINLVPEPASIGLLAIGAVGLLSRRRRR